MAVPLVGALVSFVVALLVGGFAIYVGARVVAWVAALLVLSVVNAALGVGIGAFGVPGV
jgi:hypothetical protein